jgi:outer membrane protein TolC
VRQKLGAALAIVLGACRSTPSPPPSSPADRWVPRPERRPDVQRQLPALERGPRAIDLTEALELAGARGIEIELARSRVEEAQAELDDAESRLLPHLAPRLAFFRHEGAIQETAGAFLDVDKQSTFAGATLELVLNPARGWFQSEVARRRVEASHGRLREASDATLLEVARRYYDLLEAVGVERIAEQALAHAREALSVQEAREEAGSALPADVARARARMAEAQRLVAEAREARDVASVALAEVLRLDPRAPLAARESDLVRVDFLSPDEPLELLVERALARRGELAASHADVAAARGEEREAEHAWAFPQLRAGGSFGGFGESMSSLEDQETYFIALEWDLSLGISAAQDRARARLRQAEFRRERQRDLVVADVVRAHAHVHAALERIQAARGEAEAAEQSLSLAEARHREGGGLLLEVLEAQAALTRAGSSLVSAIADYDRAQYELLRAVGGP